MKKHIQGFSFVEVITALFLLSILLLINNAFQLVIAGRDRSASMLDTATIQMASLSERVDSADISLNLDEELTRWNIKNSQLLPNGHGEINQIGTNNELVLRWGASATSCHITMQSGCLRALL